MTAYLRSLDETEKPVLNGHDVMAAGVPAGPLVGNILRELADARLDGKVRSTEDEEAVVTASLDRLKGTEGQPDER